MKSIIYTVDNDASLEIPIDSGEIYLHICKCKGAFKRMYKTELKQLNLPSLTYLLLWVWINQNRESGEPDKTYQIPDEFVVNGVCIQATDECSRVYGESILLSALDAKGKMMQEEDRLVKAIKERLGGSCSDPYCNNPSCIKHRKQENKTTTLH